MASTPWRLLQAPASRVAIELPPGFEPAELFSGFTHEPLGVSIVIAELPAPAYDTIATTLTPDILAARGVTGAKTALLARAQPYFYIRGEQASPGGVVAKFFVVFRDGDVTALITVNVPKPALETGKVAVADIERALASARIAANPAPARELFRLGYLGPFKPAGSMLGTARAFTLDGAQLGTAPAHGRALLIVAPSIDRRPIPDPDGYAAQLLASAAGEATIDITERRAVSYGGLAGVELVATARDKDAAGPRQLYQVLLVGREGGYFRIFGQAPLAERDHYLAEFRRIAAGFTLAP